jgi:murein DD-endopeptidase MepM/ murein hydrolase activator NlpD
LRDPTGGKGHFGPTAPRSGNPNGHQGLDIAGLLNISPVYANRAGTVVRAGNAGGEAGWRVVIDHGGGVLTRYVHLQANSIPSEIMNGLKKGQVAVAEGQRIGTVGNTGNAQNTPPHVHFGVEVKGKNVDPETYLNSPCP